jgi:hypothetical protein
MRGGRVNPGRAGLAAAFRSCRRGIAAMTAPRRGCAASGQGLDEGPFVSTRAAPGAGWEFRRMRRPSRSLALLAVLAAGATLAAAGTAAANQAAGAACAQKLSAHAQEIYTASAPDMTKDASIRDVLTTHTRALVMSGKVPLADARPAATEAASCLRALRE